jgi:hypothetical protein
MQGTLRPPPVAAVCVSQVGDVVHDMPPNNHDEQVEWWLVVAYGGDL